MPELFEQVRTSMREIALLESTLALLEWDERTGLPAKAGAFRADQATLLSGMIHRRRTEPALGDKIAELAQNLADSDHSQEAASVRRLKKDFERNTRLPVDLVEAISKATVLGQQAWEKARGSDDWPAFEPHMTEIFNLRKQEAELLREEGWSLYDAMLDQYEEGAKAEKLTEVFGALRDALIELVQELQAAPNPPSGDAWKVPVAVQHQREISRWVSSQIGYDFDRGRLDETSHPFCTTLGPDDCRILTRYQEEFFPSGFYGTLHEAGHGLYEQGLPVDWFGLAPGQFASLGVHESQSRMWENFVGRSGAFWKWCFPEVQKRVGGSWDGLNPDAVQRDANAVQPSLIRVEADEVTYNLHILIRFEMEQALVSGEIRVSDAPEAWNERYRKYLGIEPPSAKDGILQDVHWSAGLVGYFPTYTLGNLYAAQLMDVAEEQIGPLETQFSQGEFQPLLSWLQENVHQHGFTKNPAELIEDTTGKPLDAAPLLGYLRKKLHPIYGL